MAPTTPLKLLAQYEHPDLTPTGDLEQQKCQYRIALANCEVTVEFGTYHQTLNEFRGERLDTILQARREALEAIAIGKHLLRADNLEDFNQCAEKFRARYDSLVRSVQHLVFLCRYDLIPPVTEVM